MKRTVFLLLAFTLTISGCAAPTASPTEAPTLPPATATKETAQPQESTATPSPELTVTATPKPRWVPQLGSSFQLQFTGDPVNTSIEADIYDLDLFDTDPALIQSLHAEGKKVICYISVGSWEDWRPDASDFPSEVIGNDYEGWDGENWLDIRQIDLLAPIMRARLDLCAAKGFDGVEPDNINLHWNDTGFKISYADQLAYNLWLAEEAHARGLSIGMKNNEDQAQDLVTYFDWAITEDCFMGDWCQDMLPFIEVGKPVFAIEYTDEIGYEDFMNVICEPAADLQFHAILKNRNLDAYKATCPKPDAE